MTTRLIIAAILMLAPQFAHAGWRSCGSCFTKSYVAPVVTVQPTPIWHQHNTYFTYKFENTGLPYAAQGSTAYLAQQSQQAILQARLQIDQGSRFIDQGYQAYNTGVQANTAIAQQLISLTGDERLMQVAHQMTMDTFAKLKASGAGALLQGGQPQAGGQGQPQPGQYLQAPQQASRIQTLFNGKCVKCHGGGRMERGLDLRDVASLPLEVWEEKIMPKTKANEMPPKGEPPLAAEDHLLLCDAWTELLLNEVKGRRFSGQNPNGTPPPNPQPPAPVQEQGMRNRNLMTF